MRRVLVVRHAQASAGSDDYDRLSATGHEQARRLGRWLSAIGLQPRAVVCGAMRRHRQTLDGILEAWDPDTRPQVEAGCDPALDEFDHAAVLTAFLHRFPDHPASAAAERLWQAQPREIAALLRAALSSWSSGELDADVPEPWPAFRERVRSGAGRLLEVAMAREDMLVITSGGVLAQLALAALDAPDHRAADFNLGIRNSAVCEFVGSERGLGLLSWNTLPHLADAPELWTFY